MGGFRKGKFDSKKRALKLSGWWISRGLFSGAMFCFRECIHKVLYTPGPRSYTFQVPFSGAINYTQPPKKGAMLVYRLAKNPLGVAASEKKRPVGELVKYNNFRQIRSVKDVFLFALYGAALVSNDL